MQGHIVFFYATVIGGIVLGIGCLATALYVLFIGGSRRNKGMEYKNPRPIAGHKTEEAA